MKNVELAEKMKCLRQKAGLSQEALAATAGINLRTIQRIESGDTAPRGDTMNRIAGALNVPAGQLISPPAEQSRQKLIWLNLSALSVVVLPVFGIIIPLLVYFILRKERSKSIEMFKNKLLNFQITICVLNVMAFLLLSNMPLRVFNLGMAELIIISLYMFALFNAFMIILNSFLLYNNNKVFYFPAIPILR